MDINLGSSLGELLTRIAGVQGLIPSPYFHCTYMLIPPFLLQFTKIRKSVE